MHFPPSNRLTRRFSENPRSSIVSGFVVLGILAAWVVGQGCAGLRSASGTGPWDTRALSVPPVVTWGQKTGAVQELYYTGEPLLGKPTRVFAYIGRPATSLNSVTKHPAMVLVHGGGGKAFKDWATHWAQRGYVALAMDLAGQGPAGRLPDGGPDQADTVKFRNFDERGVRDMWSYHAVAAVLRGHSLLRSLPDVDSDRIGITGISWGGYLTCIAAGLDARFKVAVPVYGCGFLGENSVWKDKALADMAPEARERWLQWLDPSQYVGRVRYPILFVNGTTDFAYPLDSYQRTYQLVPPRWRRISVAVDRPHGHIWTFPEVDAFVDTVLGKAPDLARIGQPLVRHGKLMATIEPQVNLTNVSLCYTTNTGPWQKRKWLTSPARIEERSLVAELPIARPVVAFLAVENGTGCHMSSEHVTLAR